MDWFTVPRAEGRRYAYGPYIDFSGADRSVLAMTIPVLDPRDVESGGRAGGGGHSEDGGGHSGGGHSEGGGGHSAFLGVAGADIRMSHLEPTLLAIFRALAVPAVLVTRGAPRARREHPALDPRHPPRPPPPPR
jgi:hypothetical protein